MIEPGPEQMSPFPDQCSFQHLLLPKPEPHFPFNSEYWEILQRIHLNEAGSLSCLHMMIFVSDLVLNFSVKSPTLLSRLSRGCRAGACDFLLCSVKKRRASLSD